MPQRRFAALVLAAVATLAACGSSGDADSGAASALADGEVVAVGGAPVPGEVVGGGVGSLGDAVEVAAGALGQSADAACTVDRQTLELAIETYDLLNGSLPTSQQDLLDAQMIREPSERFGVTAEGVVIPAPGSPCP